MNYKPFLEATPGFDKKLAEIGKKNKQKLSNNPDT